MGSTRTDYNGQIYDSKFESEYAYELDMRARANDIETWERQIPLELVVNGWVVSKYKIDFLIHHKDGTKEYVETKGWASPTWKLKWKLFTALYEDLPKTKVTLVKQYENWKMHPLKRAK